MYRSSIALLVAFGAIFVRVMESHASTDSIGPNGIQSAGLGLTGNGIAIGQVEQFRSGKFGYDTDANCCNAAVVPMDVFVLDAQAGVNERFNSHALNVAGVMISTATTAPAGHFPPTGVVPSADLYSSSFPIANAQPNAAIAAQHLAAALDVSAVNMSFGLDLESGMMLNGNSLLTLFIDWSATQHDVLYVVAGDQVGVAGSVPIDNYNGVTVAMSKKNDVDGVFREVALANEFPTPPTGNRTFTDILAPGIELDLTGPNGTFPMPPDNSGTSFAAPHVTGTVALLQQYAVSNFAANANARRHEVMKAVLMNSADKLEDSGDGLRLGMTRTVIDKQGKDWLMSEAYTGPNHNMIPLDDQMGAGHLNAKRAVQQFSAGEHEANAGAVPMVGWDYGLTDGQDEFNKYVLDSALPANQFVSLTLAWDRDVFFEIDDDADNEYDIGDTFLEFAEPIDLNLYLMPAGETDIANAVQSSISSEMSVEHIFFEIATPGMYEIWVGQDSGGFAQQLYALAWWMEAIVNPAATGDYSGNGTVGPEDYDVWKLNFGTANAATDGNGNGIVDAADYTVWRDHLGQMVGSGGGDLTSVPEPSGGILFVMAAALVGRCRVKTWA